MFRHEAITARVCLTHSAYAPKVTIYKYSLTGRVTVYDAGNQLSPSFEIVAA